MRASESPCQGLRFDDLRLAVSLAVMASFVAATM
jgi:hypothetical protein